MTPEELKQAGWLSPDEAKQIKTDFVTELTAWRERFNLMCVQTERFKEQLASSKDEAKRLEAERDEAKGAFVLQKQLMKKLEAAGQGILDRLAKAEAQLKEAVDLLTRADPGKADSWPVSWSNRRDAFLAEQKEL